MEVFEVEVCENKSITVNKLRDNIPEEIERTTQRICENIMENVNEKKTHLILISYLAHKYNNPVIKY